MQLCIRCPTLSPGEVGATRSDCCCSLGEAWGDRCEPCPQKGKTFLIILIRSESILKFKIGYFQAVRSSPLSASAPASVPEATTWTSARPCPISAGPTGDASMLSAPTGACATGASRPPPSPLGGFPDAGTWTNAGTAGQGEKVHLKVQKHLFTVCFQMPAPLREHGRLVRVYLPRWPRAQR